MSIAVLTDSFGIEVSAQQGSTLNSFLLVLLLDDAFKDKIAKPSNAELFAYDIVLILY